MPSLKRRGAGMVFFIKRWWLKGASFRFRQKCVEREEEASRSMDSVLVAPFNV